MGALFSARCTSTARLDGKTTVITGANTGIGRECAKDFYCRGANVIMACRNLERANATVDEIKRECHAKQSVGMLETIALDLSSSASIRACAAQLCARLAKIDVLLNNAGVMACPLERTHDGHELQLGTNHLGHFLLTMLLMPKLRASDARPARIVTVSSMAHTRGTMDFDDLMFSQRPYNALAAYNQSKLANVLFSNELARRLRSAGVEHVNAYSLHPGVIRTELGRHLNDTYNPVLIFPFRMFVRYAGKNCLQGAQTSIYCAVSENAAAENGLYYKECEATPCAAQAANVEDAARLWEESLRLTGLPPDFDPFK